MGIMGERLTPAEGKQLILEARRAVELYLEKEQAGPFLSAGHFGEKRAIFVTINSYPSKELRGCIGFMRGAMPLGKAVREAAIHAAFGDSRFEPLQKGELEQIVFEASVLGEPKLILAKKSSELEGAIKIGRDGLIIEYGNASGLLLPQVAAEWNFTPRQFLQALCQKAGLPKDMYLSSSARIYCFEAQIFEEQSPGGKIAEKKLVL